MWLNMLVHHQFIWLSEFNIFLIFGIFSLIFGFVIFIIIRGFIELLRLSVDKIPPPPFPYSFLVSIAIQIF